MKSTSRVIMGATLILLLSLALVLCLILVLLAELYCSLLLRRCSRRTQHCIPTLEAQTHLPNRHDSSASSLTRFHSHGVLTDPPRNFLFPSLSSKHQQHLSDLENNSNQLGHFPVAADSPYSSSSAPLQIIRNLSSTSNPEGAAEEEHKLHSAVGDEGSRRLSSKLVYISNPIFDEIDEEEHCENGTAATTPSFATPDTSPSRLGNTSGSSEDEEGRQQHSNPPLKELPATEAECSV